MAQGWTPGPWRIFWARDGAGNENSHQIIGIGELTGEGIADCGFGVWRGGDAEAVANARLIAAAPALYEALAELCDRFDTIGGEPYQHPADSPWAKARAALSAARGEGG